MSETVLHSRIFLLLDTEKSKYLKRNNEWRAVHDIWSMQKCFAFGKQSSDPVSHMETPYYFLEDKKGKT